MPYIDYKISKEVDSARGTEVKVRFYEGDFFDIPDPDTGEVSSQYKRIELLEERIYFFPEGEPIRADFDYEKP